MTASLIASGTQRRRGSCSSYWDIAQNGGVVSTLLRCRLSVTEKCVIPAICEVFSSDLHQRAILAPGVLEYTNAGLSPQEIMRAHQ